ncbi:TonB-dependent receptor [Qipengyuania aquimaris]|uniref:TonB-dependent receptor plug domain-containing protein n=1 Tax=Qipengyuania aquimaris TaxID=255984 RepID=UPI001C9743D0|nr:TonB-dependent receptor [Qipengyuania aquimaris]MBY6128530.1 TonB-dependent receptor [Qipengyuania aquimaris]
MTKYVFLLTASAIPGAALAQDSTEDALAEIIAAQDAGEPADQANYGQPPRGQVEPVPVVDEPAALITVTANGLGTDIRNTGQPVTVIAREEIVSVQGADPTRVLARVPGLSFSRNGGVGGFTGVNVRGAGSEQVLVLVDGVPVADPSAPAGGFDFGSLLTGTASKIDVLRGSNSTIWGSDAIGGVIDISTRADTGFQGSLEAGSRGSVFASALGGVSDDKFYVGLTGSWYATDGFSSAVNGVEDDGFTQMATGITAFYDVAENLELSGHLNMSESQLDIDGFPAPSFALADTGETQKTLRYWGDIGLSYYGTDLTLRARYSRADTDRTNRAEDRTVGFESKGQMERADIRGEYRLVGGLTAAFGYDYQRNQYETTFDQFAQADIQGVYAQMGWVMGNLSVHAGARVDDHDYFGSETSFGADASYVLSNGWRVRASVGEGFKAPSLFQLFSDYGNRALEPEQSTSVDIGIETGRRDAGRYFSLTAFRRDSENLIDFVFCTGVAPTPCSPGQFGTYDNVERARSQGIEAEAGINLTNDLRLSGVYSLVDAEDRMTGNELARRPRNFGTFFADWQSQFGLSLGADLRIVGDSFNDAGNFTPIDGYELVDLRASFDFGDNFEVFGRVENVFDTEYETVTGYGTPGTGVFAGVRARM